jgi:excinuclease ABC subunit B
VKQRAVQTKAGAYAGTRKYGDAANLPEAVAKASKYSKQSGGGRRTSTPLTDSPHRSGGPSVPSPLEGAGTSEARSRGQGGEATSRGASKVHKPHLDEMHGPESLPFRPTGALPKKPSPVGGSKIIQPTSSRESGPEFGPAPRSSGGAPGKRGGWKAK